MRDDLDGCLCAQGAAQKNAATRTDNDSKEVWGKKTHGGVNVLWVVGVPFSIAYAAMNENERAQREFLHFSIAYAAMNYNS